MDSPFIAVIAVSRPGTELALRLRRGMPEARLFLPRRFAPEEDPAVRAWSGRAGDLIRRLFAEYRYLVVFGAVGMAVRLVAPLIRDKRTDPAVVVVDDAGRFAVSLLSGHQGGANPLAERIGGLLGAQPVITTGSEVLGVPAVDLLGREFGWRLENAEEVTGVSAALVNGDRVGWLQETGEPDWWTRDEPLPPNLLRCETLEALVGARCRAALLITDRALDGWEKPLPPSVIYRPRSLVVGIGCNRGTGAEEIEAAVAAALRGYRLARASVASFATLDLKRDEAGLLLCAEKLGVDVQYFSPAELNRVVGVPNPSTAVERWVRTRGVCEPAALLGSGARALLVTKFKTRNVTVAVARRDFTAPVEGL